MSFNDFMKYECEYKNGLVAFLDILGFKQYISTADPSNVYSLYMLMSGVYQHVLENGLNMAVFSDSVILTSNDTNNIQFIPACFYVIDQIDWCIGLQVRGGISYGNYYCLDNISFGQAIVDAYLCEESAKDIKLAIDDKAMPFIRKQYSWCLDCDESQYSINKYIFSYKSMLEMGELKLKMLGIDLKLSIEKDKEDIINLLVKYKNTHLYQKYLWLAKSFNNFCGYLDRYDIFIEKINI